MLLWVMPSTKILSGEITLPPAMLYEVHVGQVIHLARPATAVDMTYDLVELPQANKGDEDMQLTNVLDASGGNVIQRPFEMVYICHCPALSVALFRLSLLGQNHCLLCATF